jgi:lysophospholipase L1-like esterase
MQTMFAKLKTVSLVSLLAGTLNCQTSARAQDPKAIADTPPSPTVGVVADPCVALEPMPADMATSPAWQSRQPQPDFSQQCRYATANQALPPATRHRVVLMGDSITEVWGQLDPGFFSGDTINRGISGQTTDQMLGRFRADVIDLKPEVVQILAGTNDVAGNMGPTSLHRIENNIESMVELAKAHKVRVVLGSIPPAGRFGWRPSIAPIETIRTINAWMKDYATKTGVTYVDLYSALVDKDYSFKSDLSPDGVHPNSAGYAVMRPLTARAILEARHKRP